MTEEEKRRQVNLPLREALRQMVPADDLNGQMMMRELFGELPATHPDSPYADQARAIRRDTEG